jgi:hypothetical protein
MLCSVAALSLTAPLSRGALTITTNGALGTFPIGQDQVNLNASGGSGQYAWSLASGSLPPGINIGVVSFSSPAQPGLVGIATTPGNYSFDLTVNDGSTTQTQPFTMKVTALTLKDPNIPDAFVNASYSYTFTPLNDAGPVTFTVTSPALPNGLNLSADGTLFGTVATAGTYNIDFSIFDGVDTVYRGYQLVVYALNIASSGPAAGVLPNAAQGSPYSTTLTASGGAGGGYRFALTGGGLPGGFSLSSSGVVSGTTTNGPSVYGFSVTVTDSSSNSYQKTMSIDVVGSTPAQTRINLPPIDDAVVGNTYGWQVPTCCGGTAPFTWTAAGLPPGMSIRSGSGVISDYIAPGGGEIWGLASTPGNYNVTVTVTDAVGASTSLTFPFHVSVLNAVPYGLPPGTINAPYSTTFEILGGTPPYSVAQIENSSYNGFLPLGLTLNTAAAATGNFTVSGTPLENGNQNGDYDPVFKITDGSVAPNTLVRNNYFTINNVAGGISINNNLDLGSVTVGRNYSNQLTACCVANYIWSVTGGSLPAGVTLSASGLLSGAPTTAGTYTFLIKAADAAGAASPGYRQFTLNVTPISITTNSLPYGNVGAAYGGASGVAFAATGGTGALAWTVNNFSYLPPGLTLAANGALSGTPTATGQYYFGVTVTDANHSTSTAFFSVNIYAAGALPPVAIAMGPDLGTWHIGTDWVALSANGGNGTYTWSLVSGSLPPGLALRADVPSFFTANQQAGLIGVATTPGTYNFTLSVTSAGQPPVSQAFTIKISKLDLQDATPPDAFVDHAFSYTFTPIDNAGAVTFAVNVNNSTNGAMPPGLSLSSAGVLSGTPTTAGVYVIGMSIFDGVDTQYVQYNLYVYAVDITTAGVLPNGTQNGSYSTNLAASGGAGGYVWTVNCCLPPGLTLSTGGAITGNITGGPGNYTFAVTATDSNHVSSSKYMALDVVGSPIAPMRITNLTWNDPVLGDHYGNVQSVCCGGTAPFTWSVTGLPPGLTTEPNSNSFLQYPSAPGGVQIYGVAQQAGTFNVQYTVTDATGASSSVTVPLHVSVLDVNLPDQYSAYNLPNGTIDVPYTATFRVLGGSGPYSFTRTIDELPDGLAVNSSTLTVSGTPLENGSNFNAPGFLFADSSGNTLFRYESIQINGGTSTIGVNSNGFYGFNLGSTPVGAPYSTQFSACCVPSYVWSVASGSTLPPGLSLSASGQLSGTPTTVGTYSFLIDAADATNTANAGVKSFVLVVTPISVTTPSLPYGDVGTPYSASLTATGNSGTLTWTQIFPQGSQLPPGLTLSAAGTISGTPTSAGAYNIIVQAADTSGNVAIRSYGITIYASGPPPLNLPIGPTIGPFAVGGNQLQMQLSATGGVPPYHYSLTPGATVITGIRVQDGQPLPTGFPASVTGGFLGVLAPGSYSTSLRVTDSTGATFDRAVNFIVAAVDDVSQGALPRAVLGTLYAFQFTPWGGSGTYAWGGSSLPAGLTINSSTGLISGTPSASGSFSFNVSLADAAGGPTISRVQTIAVSPFAITDSPVLQEGTALTAYSHTFSAPGCGTGCAWSFFSGNLPPGFSLSSAGVLSGTYNATAGTNNTFTIQASGSAGTTQKIFSLEILPTTIQGLSITTGSIVSSNPLGVVASYELTATGGTWPYTFTLLSGTLPPGITLQGPGETVADFFSPGFTYLSGRVVQVGTYNFTIQVTDAANNTATKSFTWNVSPLSILYTALPNSGNPLIYNNAYTQPMLVIGGTGNYTSWTTAGPIYPGLSANPTTGAITGTPANTGPITTLWTVTDSSGNSASQFVSINAVSSSTSNVTLGGPGAGTVLESGTTNTFNLNPAGGTPPYTITPIGSLPAGVTLLSGNQLEIAPESAGTLTFTLQAQDSTGVTGARTYTVIATDFTRPFTTSLPTGSVGVAYSAAPYAASSASPAWTLGAGSALPPGLSLTSGVIAGTPTSAGNYTFNLLLSDASGSAIFGFSLNISRLAITNPRNLPAGVVGVPYSYQMTATGGSNLTWSWTGGLGLSMSSAGLITGTPSSAGAISPSITVTDGVAPDAQIFSLFVEEPNPTELDYPQASTALPDATAGELYLLFTLIPDGGTPPYTWAVASGSTLPPGISLLTGAALPTTSVPGATALGGYPTTAGPYSFTLTATDSTGATVTRTFTLNVTPIFAPASPPNAIEGTPYSFQLAPIGGTAPYTFSLSPVSLTQAMLPPGLSMSATGLISGTASSTGLYRFNLNVQDNAGHTLTKQFTLFSTFGSGLYISGPTTAPLAAGAIDFQSVQVFSISSGSPAALTWSVTAGTLPPGLSLEPAAGSSATLLGIVSVPGIYSFTIRATDNSNASNYADYAFTVPVSSMQFVFPAAQSLDPPPLPAGHAGTAYSFTFGVAGGTPPYTFAESPVLPLPPGLTLSPAGVLSGTPSTTGAFSLGVVVTDAAGSSNNMILQTSLVITPPGKAAPLEATPSVGFGPASVGVPYEAPLDRQVSGGTPPYTWSWMAASGSSLPAGLGISAGANGVSNYISGIPTTASDPNGYKVLLTVTDNGGQTLTIPETFTVSSLAITPNSVPPGVVGTPYSVPFFLSGGQAPYTLTTSFGAPPGLSLSSSGVLSGTPTYAGNFLFVLILKDNNGNSQSQFYELAIDNAAGEAPAISIAPKPIDIYYTLGDPAPSIPLTISSTSGNLSFTAAFTGIAGASLAATSGTTPNTIDLNFGGSVLTTPGTYSGLAAVSAPGATNRQDAVPITLTVAAPPPCNLTLNPSTVDIPAIGGTGSFNVIADSSCAPWSATASDPSVVTITSATSGTGNGTITYTVAANTSVSPVTETITVAGQTYTITQFSSGCSFGINPAAVNTTSAAGSAIVSVVASNSSCVWPAATGLVVMPIPVPGHVAGTGSGQALVAIPANAGTTTQTLNATIAGQALTIVQNAPSCTVSLGSPTASFNSAGGPGSVGVTTPAGCLYSTVNGPSWISVTSGASGTGPGTLTFSVDQNSTTVARSGALTIGGQSFQISEQGQSCSVSVDTSALGSPFASAGGTGTIHVMSGPGCGWTAGSANALFTVSPSSGTGNSTVTVTTAAANSAAGALTGSVTISGQNIGVSQAGTTCSYTLRSPGGNAPYSGGAGSVGVIAASGCTWAAVSNNTDWLTITSSGSGGTADIQFVAQANTSANPQAGTLTITGGSTTLTYTVTEAGAPCSFSLPVSSISVAQPGVTGSTFGFTTAQTGCAAPTPVSYANWLTVASPPAFDGTTGTVTYSASANPAGTTRIGTIQIGNQLFTVSQLGASCAFSLNLYGALYGQAGGSSNVLGSESATGCALSPPGTDQPSIVTLGTLANPASGGDVFTQPYTVVPFTSATNAVRKATITFGGQIVIIKQTSW